MAEAVRTKLDDEILPLLQKERFVLLATIDHETKGPNVNAISWVYAVNSTNIRFAVAHKSRIVENIKADPKVNLTFFALGSVYTVSGHAQILEEKMNGPSIHLAKIEIKVDGVRDVMFYGTRIEQEPTYVKTYDAALAEKLDKEVLSALKA